MQPNTPSAPAGQRHPINWPKYIVALIITSLIFGSALYVNNILSQKRMESVEGVRDQIALDLLSSETQFNLLRETSCSNLGSNALSEELNSLASKLELMEANDAGKKNPELIYLKKYYSLLEIKDFLLLSELKTKCSQKPISILYFYGNGADCPACGQTAIVLNALRQDYEDLRVYSFDTTLDLSALHTLKSTYKVDSENLPALVINEKTYVGFKSIDEIKELIPELKRIDAERAKEAEKAAASTSRAASGQAANQTASPASQSRTSR